ncbi:hypothetical protein GN956_G4035 [Arapaima gigas]
MSLRRYQMNTLRSRAAHFNKPPCPAIRGRCNDTRPRLRSAGSGTHGCRQRVRLTAVERRAVARTLGVLMILLYQLLDAEQEACLFCVK